MSWKDRSEFKACLCTHKPGALRGIPGHRSKGLELELPGMHEVLGLPPSTVQKMWCFLKCSGINRACPLHLSVKMRSLLPSLYPLQSFPKLIFLDFIIYLLVFWDSVLLCTSDWSWIPQRSSEEWRLTALTLSNLLSFLCLCLHCHPHILTPHPQIHTHNA